MPGRYGWVNADRVNGTRGITVEYKAYCLVNECQWVRRDLTGKKLNAGRVAARRHASVNRHKVAIVQTVIHYFTPETT